MESPEPPSCCQATAAEVARIREEVATLATVARLMPQMSDFWLLRDDFNQLRRRVEYLSTTIDRAA